MRPIHPPLCFFSSSFYRLPMWAQPRNCAHTRYGVFSSYRNFHLTQQHYFLCIALCTILLFIRLSDDPAKRKWQSFLFFIFFSQRPVVQSNVLVALAQCLLSPTTILYITAILDSGHCQSFHDDPTRDRVTLSLSILYTSTNIELYVGHASARANRHCLGRSCCPKDAHS